MLLLAWLCRFYVILPVHAYVSDTSHKDPAHYSIDGLFFCADALNIISKYIYITIVKGDDAKL